MFMLSGKNILLNMRSEHFEHISEKKTLTRHCFTRVQKLRNLKMIVMLTLRLCSHVCAHVIRHPHTSTASRN